MRAPVPSLKPSRSALLLVVVAATLPWGCDADPIDGGDGGADLAVVDLGAPAFEDASVNSTGEDLAVRLPSCAMASFTSNRTSRPVDFLFVIDNTDSMSDEFPDIQQNISTNFLSIIGRSGIDFRVIFLTSYGSWKDQKLCLPPPVSRQSMNCDPPDAKLTAWSPRHFHYDQPMVDNQLFQTLLDTYRRPDPWGLAPKGWSGLLRPEAVKVFIVITDDNAATSWQTFDSDLLALDPVQFGSVQKRNYLWHSIIGVGENNPPDGVWGPNDPVQLGPTCGREAVSIGEDYQRLSILTGGVRMPICQHASLLPLFIVLAKGFPLEEPLPCQLPLPTPPRGRALDDETLVVELTIEGQEPWYLRRADGPHDCTIGAFYLDGNHVTLCPSTCSQAAMARAAVTVRVLGDCR